MRYRLHWLFVGGLAACTPRIPFDHIVPDRFDENLDVITRSVTHPCGADVDNNGDGMVDVQWSYTYDSLGRSVKDVAVDLTGTINNEEIDYTWDNAGHLVEEHHSMPGWGPDTFDYSSVYDTLGRRTQYKDERSQGTTVLTRHTISYSEFDELGHSTHGDSLVEDFTAHTTTTLTRTYGYDDLGRRISFEAHFASGDLYQSEQDVYDDVALTITTNYNEPLTLRGEVGVTDVQVGSFDAAYHLIADHDVATNLDGSGVTTIDDTNVWDGDRQLSNSETVVWPPSPTITTLITYKYQCDGARVLPPPNGVATHAKPVHRARTVQ